MRTLVAAASLALVSCYGPEGASGPQGPQGPGGGGGLRWVDATGATIPGFMLNPYETTRFAYFDGNGNLWGVNHATGAVGSAAFVSTNPIFYTTIDCTGASYIPTSTLPDPRVVFEDAFTSTPGYKAAPDAGGADITHESLFDGVCQTVQGTVNAVDVDALPVLTPPAAAWTVPLHPEP